MMKKKSSGKGIFGMEKVYLNDFEELVLIAVARLGDDAYGVKIRRTIEEVGERFISIGAVYSTLERLEEKGLVSSWQGKPTAERGGRAKRFFRVEDVGLRAIAETHRVRRKMVEGVLGLEPS
jgi:DNA-binding PadR family transcriptional regulator